SGSAAFGPEAPSAASPEAPSGPSEEAKEQTPSATGARAAEGPQAGGTHTGAGPRPAAVLPSSSLFSPGFLAATAGGAVVAAVGGAARTVLPSGWSTVGYLVAAIAVYATAAVLAARRWLTRPVPDGVGG